MLQHFGQAPFLGSAETNLLRYSYPAYEDGRSVPAGSLRRNAREISNKISDTWRVGTGEVNSTRDLSSFAYIWAQVSWPLAAVILCPESSAMPLLKTPAQPPPPLCVLGTHAGINGELL